MIKYVLFFLFGVLIVLLMRTAIGIKNRIYIDVMFIFINLVVILIHEDFNILVSTEIWSFDSKIVYLAQSIGFLTLLKLANILLDWMTRGDQHRLADELDSTYDEWRETTIGILLIMGAINDFLLGFIFEKDEYFTQATFLFVIFIGFFIQLSDVVGRHTLEQKVAWGEKINTIIKKWVKKEMNVIIICIIFFVVGDLFLYNLTISETSNGVWGMLAAFIAGAGLIIFIDKWLCSRKDM